MLTHHNLVNNSYWEEIWTEFKCKVLAYLSSVYKTFFIPFETATQDKLCLPTPLFHCYENTCRVMTALHFGRGIVFPSEGFDPVTTVKAASDEKLEYIQPCMNSKGNEVIRVLFLYRCTAINGTPTMYIDMLGVIEQGRAPTLRKTIINRWSHLPHWAF